jgi:hypothetical protein
MMADSESQTKDLGLTSVEAAGNCYRATLECGYAVAGVVWVACGWLAMAWDEKHITW